MQSTVTFRRSCYGTFPWSRYFKLTIGLLVKISEGVSTLVFLILVILMWVDLFTTIVVVSAGIPELNSRGAWIIATFGFWGLAAFQGIQVAFNLVIYLVTGSKSPIGYLTKKIGKLFSEKVEKFLDSFAYFSGWLARIIILYCWIETIEFMQYNLTNSIYPGAVPQVQMTVRIIMSLLKIDL